MKITKGKLLCISILFLVFNFIFMNIKSFATENIIFNRYELTEKLNKQIQEIKTLYDIDIKILTTDDLKGREIENVANDYYFENLYDNKKNVLILIAKNDRKIRIHTGPTAKKTMTNLLTDKMVDTLIPYFSEEEYDKGLEEALNTFLIEVNNSEPIETTTYKSLSKTFKSIIIGFFKSLIVSQIFANIMLFFISVYLFKLILFILKLIIHLYNLTIDRYNKDILKPYICCKKIEIPKNKIVKIKLTSKEDKLGRKSPFRIVGDFFSKKYIHSYIDENNNPVHPYQVEDILKHNKRLEEEKKRNNKRQRISCNSYDYTYIDFSSSSSSSSFDCGGSTGSW